MSEDLRELKTPLEIGGYQQGNYSVFSQRGFLRAYGGAIAYRDEYPSHPWGIPNGAQEPAETVVPIAGVSRILRFFDNGVIVRKVSTSFEIPHDYAYYPDLGVYLPIEMHAHTRPDDGEASGVYKFSVDWEYSPPNGAPNAGGTVSFLRDLSSGGSELYNLLNSFTTDLFSGKEFNPELGGQIGINLYRDPTDPEDTYDGGVYLEQVALHIPVCDMGSRQRYEK